MLDKNLLAAIDDLSQLTGVPLLLVDGEGQEIAVFPEEIGNIFRSEYYAERVEMLRNLPVPSSILLINSGDVLNTGCVQLCDGVYLFTAPIAVTPKLGPAFMHSILPVSSFLIRSGCQSYYYNLSLTFPILSAAHLVKALKIACTIAGNPAAESPARYYHSFEDVANLIPVQVAQKSKADLYKEAYRTTTDQPHASPLEETALLDAVESGDEAKIRQIISRPEWDRIGQMSLDHVRQEKYKFVCCIFMVSRAAIRGGLSHEIAFELSDGYCQQMDGCRSAIEVRILRNQMIEDYCHRVSELKGHHAYSTFTRACCDYIHTHLYERLSVEVLSESVHLNRRSLSVYFKNDTGMSIPEYIRHYRLKEAKYLLSNSDISLSEISEMLCFSNQSHFCKIFREEFGITPQIYRLNSGNTNQNK